MPSSLKDIHWMSSPLAIRERERIDKGIGKFLDPKARSFLDPKKEYRFFHKIKHWALEVDGWCYEVLPIDNEKKAIALVRLDACKPHPTKAKVWHDFRVKHGIEPEVKKVGQTHMTHEEIMSRVNYIWEHFNHDLYILLVQNCQNFAKMLHESIATPADHPGVTDSEKALWLPIPNPVSYTLANISQSSLASGGSVGMTRLYLAAFTPAEAIKGGAAVGVIGTTAEGGGTVSAAGGAASQTAVTTQTAAVGTQTAGTTQTAAVGTQTAATTQTAAVGTSHGTAATAGGGKVGLGAKFSAAMHGAGGAKVATLAKVGAVAAMAHPVTAVGVIGLGLIAAGKRDKGWIKRHKNGIVSEMDGDFTAEITVSDLLLAEEALLEHAEDSANMVDEVDEKLAEDLKLLFITTEPAIMPDEVSYGDELVSAGEDPKRSQTLA